MILTRFRYLSVKIAEGWKSGRLREQITAKTLSIIYVSAVVLARFWRLGAADRRLSLKDGFGDARNAYLPPPDGNDRELVRRIKAAYSKAKLAQKNAPKCFDVKGLWAEWIRVNYGDLLSALAEDDPTRALSYLRNFCREPFAVGTGASFDDLKRVKCSLLGKYYVASTWCRYRDKLKDSGYDMSRLNFPHIGNPAGFVLNGDIIPTETLRHAYNAHYICELLCDVANPVIVEIGGGFGDQAYQVITHARDDGTPVAKYFDFDIPEVLLVASYFLLKAFPDRRICLYGEGDVSGDHEIVLLPHFAIDDLPDSSADLVLNTHSFSEMDEACARHYLEVTNRICRKYFHHINHEQQFSYRHKDGSIISNLIGSRMIPDRQKFKRLYKCPRVMKLPEDELLDSFAYLYERKSAGCTPASQAAQTS
jgi:putative sugar O-methyltransferase